MTRADLQPLKEALADRAETLARVLLPGGRMEGGEWKAGARETGFGAVGVVVKGAKRGRVGFWTGRPDNPAKDGGDLLHLIMAVHRLSLGDAIRWAQDWLGGAAVSLPPARPPGERTREEQKLAEWKIGKARKLWAEARPGLAGTLAETYLAGRGITLDLAQVSDDVRFARRCEHWRSASRDGADKRVPGLVFPAIVSAIRQPDGSQTAAHVTFLARDGAGKAPVEAPKLMMGEVRGGAIIVRAHAPGAPCIYLEGLEDALTALMAAPEDWGIRAVTSLANLRHQKLTGPAVIVADNDWGNDAALEAFRRAVKALKAQGFPVRVLRATGGAKDLNDMVKPK